MALKDSLWRIDTLKKEWDKLQPLSKEADEKLWKKFRLEWNYNSNHLEGNTLTYGETELLLIYDKTSGDHELREFQEMKAHDLALKTIETWANDKSRDLTEADIRALNKIILVEPFWKEAVTSDNQRTRRLIKIGEYKEFPNSVRLKNGEVFQYSSPQDTPALMNDLMNWVRENIALQMHPLVLAAQFHYKFVRIHPFDDGNGRISRLLTNYFLMKSGFPPVIVKSADKERYLTALQKADVGDLDAFSNYVGEQLIWSLNIAISAAKGKNIEESDDLDKKIELLKREGYKTEKVKIKKSREVLQKLYQLSLQNLFTEISAQLRKFNDLFLEVGWRYTIYNPIETNVVKGYGTGLECVEEQIFFDALDVQKYGYLLDNRVYRNGTITPPFVYPDLQRINLSFSWTGYKNAGLDTFGIWCEIVLSLKDFKYTLNILNENNMLFEKLYDQPVSTLEAKEISKAIANHVLVDIEQHLNRIKKK